MNIKLIALIAIFSININLFAQKKAELLHKEALKEANAGNIEKGIEKLKTILEKYKKYEYYEKAFFTIPLLYADLGDEENYIDWIHKLLNSSIEDTKEDYTMGEWEVFGNYKHGTCSNLGVHYYKKKDYINAKKYYQLAQTKYQYQHTSGTSIQKRRVALDRYISDCYYNLNQLDSALYTLLPYTFDMLMYSELATKKAYSLIEKSKNKEKYAVELMNALEKADFINSNLEFEIFETKIIIPFDFSILKNNLSTTTRYSKEKYVEPKNVEQAIEAFKNSEFYKDLTNNKPDLRLNGDLWNFDLTPNGTAWICSNIGETYYLDKSKNEWQKVSINSDKNSRIHIKEIKFFNDKIGIIYGFLKQNKKDFIYRTVDGGKNWLKVFLPETSSSMWVNSSHLANTGMGWLGSSNYIFKTTDYGETWRLANTIHNSMPDKSPCKIKFNDDGTALFITCQMNELRAGKNNFETIENVELPSDQGLIELEKSKSSQNISQVGIAEDGSLTFTDVSNTVDSQVSNVEFLADLIFIIQKDKLFYTKLSEINWKEYKHPNCIDMATDGKKLYILGKDLKFYEINKELEIKQFNSKAITEKPKEIICQNNTIYTLDLERDGITIITKDKITYK